MDSAHCNDNHDNANEACCFASGGITIFDRTWGDVDSRDPEGGVEWFQGPWRQCRRKSLVDASLTETACAVTRACAIARSLSGMEM